MNAVIHPVFPAEKPYRFLRLLPIENCIIEFADITAGAKGSLTGALNDHDADSVIIGPAVQDVLDLLDHVFGKRVESARGVQCQNTHVPFAACKFLGLYRHWRFLRRIKSILDTESNVLSP